MRTKSTTKNKINVITLGCSKNIYDSEVLMGQLKANDKEVVHEEDGNIVVINTCGFIDNAKEESVNTILDNIQRKEAWCQWLYRHASTATRRIDAKVTLDFYQDMVQDLLFDGYMEINGNHGFMSRTYLNFF